jgi:eukaryotic-like serine/threonine-protein kinase
MNAEGTGRSTDDRWERLQALFSRAVELNGPDRQLFVARETAGDTELRTELLELLACDAGSSHTGPLTLALGAALDTTTRERRKALIGRILGNYKLVSVLGHGGTGTVYLGERADRQYSAQVAVKIVDNGTMQGELGLRFRAERQILASLNHANIARLIDAGETDEGNPYLVMEYVHGEPLDRYCDRQQLGLRERLQLFLDICGAVQYAHQNLVVHRDLKPANILVTAEGAPKLLDFGIAKLLDAGEAAAAAMALTRMNDRLLTPEYASPEQILGRPVTTASDVYALGVVLYELLTGLRPYTVPASASQLELERSICIMDPLRPSTAVKRARESGPLEGQSEMLAVAMARRLTPQRLQKRLVGDIDAIVMRALRKEPQHRYNSIEQLASDVRRFLAREPVQARQGNWLYYSQRFVRRHAFGVTAGAAFIVFIIAFAIAMSVQTQRIAEQRDLVEQENVTAVTVSGFMEEIFDASQPDFALGRNISAREVLDEAGRRIRGDLSKQPEVRARLMEAIGRAYRRLNLNEVAVPYFEDSLHLRKQLPDQDGTKTASVLLELAMVVRKSGDLERADRLLNEALKITVAHRAERSETYAKLLVNLGRVHVGAGNLTEARDSLERARELFRGLSGPLNPYVGDAAMELATVFMWQDNLTAAEQSAREAMEVFTATRPLMHPDRVAAGARLGQVLQLQGRISEAAVLFENSLDAQVQLYGADSVQVADVLDSLAGIKKAQGMLPAAEEYARRALRVQEKSVGAEHQVVGYQRTVLAAILLQRGNHKEAEQQSRAALTIFDKRLPPDHQYVASAEHVLGEALLELGQLEQAEAALNGAVNRWKRNDVPAWRVARSESALGQTLYRLGRTAEAERYLKRSYMVLAADEHADREARIKAQQRISQFYIDRGQREKLGELSLATRGEAGPPTERVN